MTFSLRAQRELIEALEPGQRIFVEVESADEADRQSRSIATTLRVGVPGKQFSVRRCTALGPKFGAEPFYLLAIERIDDDDEL